MWLLGASAGIAIGQGPSSVVVVVNDASPLSRSVGEYYARRRSIPIRNLCHIRTSTQESVGRDEYNRGIADPLAAFLRERKLTETTWYIVTTVGVPLIVSGEQGVSGDIAAVDSELTLLYSDMREPRRYFRGSVPNPMFGRVGRPLTRREFPMYLVARLAGYDFADIRGLVDRSLVARNRGRVVLDLRDYGDPTGDDWLRAAARHLPRDRVTMDESSTVLYRQKNVIGYASWGSNDKNRHRRTTGNEWLPGAVATEFVSTNARTFSRPPDNWELGTWNDTRTWFAGAPQSIIGDTIHEGVTAVTGHVAEPYLMACPRPEYLFGAYIGGSNLAQSFYASIPALSWQNIVVGDPLCRLLP